MIKAILFDLDGTLLPMDIEKFTKSYFNAIAMELSKHQYDPKALISGILKGTGAMVKNTGTETNETVFWKTFSSLLGDHVYEDQPYFDAFYEQKFDQIQKVCGYTEEAGRLINDLKKKGYRLILATNPIFPMIAQKKRLVWAGVDVDAFEWITSYENSHYCKPNLKYYEEILKQIDCLPEECMMIGNDVTEDMVARQLGMKVFLLTNCLINKDNIDLSPYPRGSFTELRTYLDTVLD